MAPEEARIAETRAWLGKAADDLRAADHLFRLNPPLFGVAIFHCQQAAEKAMKGFLTWHDVPFRKTHNLEEIGEQCLAVDASLRAVIDPAVPLTQYAWRFRYPGEREEPTLTETREALTIARATYEEALARLPPAVQP